MVGWTKQSNFVIEKELYTGIIRNNIDIAHFQTEFLKPLKKSRFQKLKNIRKQCKSDSKWVKNERTILLLFLIILLKR
jgi:hypothetical protein